MKLKTQNKAASSKTTMKRRKRIAVKTGVRAGGISANHNKTMVVRTGVRGGGLMSNHNNTMVMMAPPAT